MHQGTTLMESKKNRNRNESIARFPQENSIEIKSSS
jgi:hypothetical protein